jgi:hypothetical protein
LGRSDSGLASCHGANCDRGRQFVLLGEADELFALDGVEERGERGHDPVGRRASLAFAVARRWPSVLSNAVDPGWVRTRMGGPSAPLDLDTGQRTQSWLAVSEDPEAMVSGAYWKNRRRERPAPEAMEEGFQDRLLARLQDLTGVALPPG